MTDQKPKPPAADPGLAATPDGKLKKPRPAIVQEQAPGEVGGPTGPEPTRYGDWEKNGIVSDF